jgi:hypothetical protein
MAVCYEVTVTYRVNSPEMLSYELVQRDQVRCT